MEVKLNQHPHILTFLNNMDKLIIISQILSVNFNSLFHNSQLI